MSTAFDKNNEKMTVALCAYPNINIKTNRAPVSTAPRTSKQPLPKKHQYNTNEVTDCTDTQWKTMKKNKAKDKYENNAKDKKTQSERRERTLSGRQHQNTAKSRKPTAKRRTPKAQSQKPTAISHKPQTETNDQRPETEGMLKQCLLGPKKSGRRKAHKFDRALLKD